MSHWLSGDYQWVNVLAPAVEKALTFLDESLFQPRPITSNAVERSMPPRPQDAKDGL